MSERLEDINFPPRLLAAIRNEVSHVSEQQLNDLWMVVHSLKDSAVTRGSGAKADPELAPMKDSLASLQRSVTEMSGENKRLREGIQQIGPEVEKKIQGAVQHLSVDMPARLSERLEGLEALRDRAEKVEREISQIGGATALLETRLYDLENRLLRRVEALENRSYPVMSAGSAAPGDNLSDEALVNQPSSVNFLVDDLLKVVLKYEGSDLFLKSNALPYTSLSGELVPIGKQVLNAEDCRRIILLALTLPKRKELLERRSAHQLACWHDTVFRICAYFERDRISASIQRVATQVPSIEDLGLPRTLEILSLEENGLILVVAPPHASRHETLISLLQHVNRNRKIRLFTLEEKIQYELTDAEALVTQQEVGTDVPDLATGLSALKMLLPDGVMVSHALDTQSVSQLLELINSQSLVLVGVEATRAIDGLEAFLNLVPAERRSWALEVLGRQLRAVLAQASIPRLDGEGSVLATELLLNNSDTNEFLCEGHLRLLEPLMERGGGGMHTLKMSIRRLSEGGLIKPPAIQAAQTELPLPLPERPTAPLVSGSLRRERKASESARLDAPPDEGLSGPSRYALSSPPPPASVPVATPPVTAAPTAAPPPQPVTAPGSPPSEAGDDTLMGWL